MKRSIRRSLAAGSMFLAAPCALAAQVDVNGVFRDQDGRFAEVTQNGTNVSVRTGAGLLFEGTIGTDGRLRLRYRMDTYERVPYRQIPPAVRRQLIGGTIDLNGTAVSTGDTLRLELVSEAIQWDPQTLQVTTRTPSSASFLYVRSPIVVAAVTFNDPRYPTGSSVAHLGGHERFDLRIYVPAKWDGRPPRIDVTVAHGSTDQTLELRCDSCDGVVDNLVYVRRDSVAVDGRDPAGRLSLRLLGMRMANGDTLRITYQGVTRVIRVWHHTGLEIRPVTATPADVLLRLPDTQHVYNFRTDDESPNGAGRFHISGVARSEGDPARIEYMRAQITTDTDPTGLTIMIPETGPATDRFWTQSPIALSTTAAASTGTTLRVRPGDRIYARNGDRMEDVAWTSGGGVQRCGAAMTPAYRVPVSRAQYAAMRSMLPAQAIVGHPGRFATFEHLTQLSDGQLASRYSYRTFAQFEQMLRNPAYMTAEEIIATKWPRIVAVAAAERVPPVLLGAVLLQNMRSMNDNDIVGDGRDYVRTLWGKSVGISQTPYEIAQKVARWHGITSLGIPAGTALSDDRTFDLLFDADSSINVAAAHLRLVADSAMPYGVRSGSGGNFDLALIAASGAVTDAERTVAAVLGYNMDQWQITGWPATMQWVSSDPYQTGIVQAFEDIRAHLPAGAAALASGFSQTPRVYVESVLPFNLPMSQGVPCFWGFLAGDISSNPFPRDGVWSRRIPAYALGR